MTMGELFTKECMGLLDRFRLEQPQAPHCFIAPKAVIDAMRAANVAHKVHGTPDAPLSINGVPFRESAAMPVGTIYLVGESEVFALEASGAI